MQKCSIYNKEGHSKYGHTNRICNDCGKPIKGTYWMRIELREMPEIYCDLCYDN